MFYVFRKILNSGFHWKAMQYTTDTILCKSNANQIRRNLRFVLAKFRGNLTISRRLKTKFRRNIRDISLCNAKPLTKVSGGANSPVRNFATARRTLVKFRTHKVQENTAKNRKIEVWRQSRQKLNNKAQIQSLMSKISASFVCITLSQYCNVRNTMQNRFFFQF